MLVSRPIVRLLTPADPFEPVGLFLISFRGVVIGQCCFVAVASALRWRSWGAGYTIGIVVSYVGLLTLTFAFWLVGSNDIDEMFLSLAIIPAALLSLALPLIALRHVFGWRLVAGDETAPHRDTFRIADLFALTTIVAANLALLRIPQVIMEEDAEDFWGPMLVFCGMGFAIGLLLLPICVRLVLGTKRRLGAIAGLTLLAVLVPACIFGIAFFAMPGETTWSQRFAAVKFPLAVCGGAIVASYASLFALARCGMSLARTTKEPVSSGAAASKDTSTRWLAVGSIAVAIVVSIGLARLEQHRKFLDAEIVRLENESMRLGGAIEIRGRRIVTLELRRGATDGDLDQFLRWSDVASIDLSHSSVTDLGLAKLKHFRKTTSLTLNGTHVTDQGLVALEALRDLEWLELNGTQVTGRGFAQVDVSPKIIVLNVEDTRFDDVGCQALRRFPNLGHLSLAGTRVTDEGIRDLRSLTKLEVLNASRTAVTGEGLSSLSELTILRLDGAKIDDMSISNVTKLDSLVRLDLGHTTITDVALEQLHMLRALRDLTLTETAVTGDGFRVWSDQNQMVSLTLTRTAIHDAAVKHLKKFSPLKDLDLSETALSDACLADLAEMQIGSLNLSQTKITAAGLLAAGMKMIDDLQVAPGQFTDAEHQQLSAQLSTPVYVYIGDFVSDDE